VVTGERGARVRRRPRSVRHPGRAPWAGAPALQSGERLRAVSAIRPEPGIEAKNATGGGSQPGSVHTRLRPKGRLRGVKPPCPWRLLPLRPALEGRLKILSAVRWARASRSSGLREQPQRLVPVLLVGAGLPPLRSRMGNASLMHRWRRIAFGPGAGQKVPTLRGAMPRETTARQALCADIDGFSLHPAVRVESHNRKRLERLCRHITRPALSDERIQVNAAGQVALELETPWRG
jgi:hypothetical protein